MISGTKLYDVLRSIDVGGLWANVDWNLDAVRDDDDCVRIGWLVSLTYREPDIQTGKVEEQTTRQWFVAKEATVNDVLRTVRKLLLGSMEHRVDEHFLFNGQRVYDPHKEVVAG